MAAAAWGGGVERPKVRLAVRPWELRTVQTVSVGEGDPDIGMTVSDALRPQRVVAQMLAEVEVACRARRPVTAPPTG